MYTLVWTNTFTRTAKRFFRHHLDLKDTFADILHRLESDPFDPSLRLHNLQGKLADKQSVSLTYSYRIILNVEIVGQQIISTTSALTTMSTVNSSQDKRI